MSNQAATWVIERSRHKGGAFVLLLMIAHHCNREGENAFPSLKTLAEEARTSLRSVQRLLPVLEASGELIVLRDETYGQGHRIEFSLPHVRPWLEAWDAANGDKMSPFGAEKRKRKATSVQRKGDSGARKGDSGARKGDIPTRETRVNLINPFNHPIEPVSISNQNENEIGSDLPPPVAPSPLPATPLLKPKCKFGGCPERVASTPHVARYCTRHGDPRSGYIQLATAYKQDWASP